MTIYNVDLTTKIVTKNNDSFNSGNPYNTQMLAVQAAIDDSSTIPGDEVILDPGSANLALRFSDAAHGPYHLSTTRMPSWPIVRNGLALTNRPTNAEVLSTAAGYFGPGASGTIVRQCLMVNKPIILRGKLVNGTKVTNIETAVEIPGVITALAGNAVNIDTKTLTIIDNLGVTKIFEFDQGGNGVSGTNIAIPYNSSDTAAQVAAAIHIALNNAGLNITAAEPMGAVITLTQNSGVPGTSIVKSAGTNTALVVSNIICTNALVQINGYAATVRDLNFTKFRNHAIWALHPSSIINCHFGDSFSGVGSRGDQTGILALMDNYVTFGDDLSQDPLKMIVQDCTSQATGIITSQGGSLQLTNCSVLNNKFLRGTVQSEYAVYVGDPSPTAMSNAWGGKLRATLMKDTHIDTVKSYGLPLRHLIFSLARNTDTVFSGLSISNCENNVDRDDYNSATVNSSGVSIGNAKALASEPTNTGAQIKNIVIYNNKFNDCNRGYVYLFMDAGAIFDEVIVTDNLVVQKPEIIRKTSDIVIESNNSPYSSGYHNFSLIKNDCKGTNGAGIDAAGSIGGTHYLGSGLFNSLIQENGGYPEEQGGTINHVTNVSGNNTNRIVGAPACTLENPFNVGITIKEARLALEVNAYIPDNESYVDPAFYPEE